MRDILIALGASTATLVMYALGYRAGRSEPTDPRTIHGIRWVINEWRIGWRQGAAIRRGRRCQEANRRAERYRLAWLSARRRAHRGRLLAQLLREDER